MMLVTVMDGPQGLITPPGSLGKLSMLVTIWVSLLQVLDMQNIHMVPLFFHNFCRKTQKFKIFIMLKLTNLSCLTLKNKKKQCSSMIPAMKLMRLMRVATAVAVQATSSRTTMMETAKLHCLQLGTGISYAPEQGTVPEA